MGNSEIEERENLENLSEGGSNSDEILEKMIIIDDNGDVLFSDKNEKELKKGFGFLPFEESYNAPVAY